MKNKIKCEKKKKDPKGFSLRVLFCVCSPVQSLDVKDEQKEVLAGETQNP